MDVPVLQYRYRRLALTAVSLELPCLLIYPLFYFAKCAVAPRAGFWVK